MNSSASFRSTDAAGPACGKHLPEPGRLFRKDGFGGRDAYFQARSIFHIFLLCNLDFDYFDPLFEERYVMKLTVFAAFACASFAATTASAVPIQYFGENLTPDGMVTGDPVTAHDRFIGSLVSGVGTEDFETGGLSLSFPGSTGDITATLSGGGATVRDFPESGRFATSGSSFVQTDSGGDFTIQFSAPISAFGFYGTDVGDFGNKLTLELANGTTTVLEVGNTGGSQASTNGALLFFGFIDKEDSYTKITFHNDPGTEDVFGFDDMTIGDFEQIGTIIAPDTGMPAIPVPATLPMLMLAIGALSLSASRRKL